MSETAKRLYTSFVEDVINKGNYDLIPEIYSEDYVDHNAPPGAPVGGFDAIKAIPMMFRGAFPDVHFVIEDMVSQGDWVATRVTGRATHLGKPFMGIEPSGLKATWSSMGFFREANGRIVEHYGQPDFGALRQQLTRPVQPGTLDYNRLVTCRYVYATNIGDLDKFDVYVDPAFVDHNALPGQKPGIEGLKDAYRMFSSAFSDLWYTFEDLVAEGDRVVGRGTIQGRHTGQFMWLQPTNRVMTWTGTRIFKIVNGKVTDGWIDLDMFGLMMQMGAIPMPGQGG